MFAAAGHLSAVPALVALAVWSIARPIDDVAVRKDVPAAPDFAAAEQRSR